MVGVTQCATGHDLQECAAQSGRCQECDRWIFGQEKVMGCACPNCYYCSTCAPQVRSRGDDHLWEDFLSTVGSALRDAEKLKGQASVQLGEMSNDFERMKSAFNCQAPGNETLSAEQIFIEHTFEQAKSTLSCSGPDAADLHAHEEVIPSSAVAPEVLETRAPVESVQALQTSIALAQETPPMAASENFLDLSQAAKAAPMDLLDLSDTGMVKVAPKNATDLLDLSDLFAPEVKAPSADTQCVNFLDIGDPTLGEGAQQKIVDATLGQGAHGSAATPKVHEIADLLDFSEQPDQQPTAKVLPDGL